MLVVFLAAPSHSLPPTSRAAPQQQVSVGGGLSSSSNGTRSAPSNGFGSSGSTALNAAAGLSAAGSYGSNSSNKNSNRFEGAKSISSAQYFNMEERQVLNVMSFTFFQRPSSGRSQYSCSFPIYIRIRCWFTMWRERQTPCCCCPCRCWHLQVAATLSPMFCGYQ